ncbi:MAG: Gluconolactonase, partial [uncultured Gemmatimonadetes bacterium]
MAEADFEILDPAFRRCVRTSARVECLHQGGRWVEGPAYFPAHRALVWSDIPNDRLLRFDECSGHVSVFRETSGYINGNTVDRQGRLVSCEQGGRRVSRTEHDGSTTVLADRFEGKRFNSPNDVVVSSDGSVWFTDPTYGIDSNYEGMAAESEIGASHLYRIDAATGAVEIAANDFVRPNGLAFSPDERRLYVADTGATHLPDGPRHIRVFDVGPGGALAGGEVFATCTNGMFDGFRVDTAGRLWASAADGV